MNQEYIQTKLVRSIPPIKQISITEFGAQSFYEIFRPLNLLHSGIKSEKSLKNSKLSTKLYLDSAEQIDLIEFIMYTVLNFTENEMEELPEKEAERLRGTAALILKRIAKTLDIEME